MATFKVEYNATNVFVVPAEYGTNQFTGDDTDFEAGVGSWTSAHFTLASSTDQAVTGTHSLKATSNGTGAGQILSGPELCTAGERIGAYLSIRAGSTVRTTWLSIRFYSDTAGTVFLSETIGASIIDSASAWKEYFNGGLAPATTQSYRIQVLFGNRASSEVHYIDAVHGSISTGTTAIRVEGWGAGGAGAAGQAARGGGGGGGGAYGRWDALAVSPGQSFNVIVGTALATRLSSATANALNVNSGNNGSTFNGGGGGAAGTGDAVFAGGNGRTVPIATTAGGGGGGAAGDAGAGGTAVGQAGAAGGTAGGGNGGSGGALNQPGAGGAVPGGGGGGSGAGNAATAAGGSGRLIITFDFLSDLVGKGTVTHTKATENSFSVTGKGVATESRAVVASKSFDLVGKGTITHTKAAAVNLALTGKGTVSESRAIVAAKSFDLVGKGTASESRVVVASKSFDLTGKGEVTSSKATVAARSFDLIGKGVVTEVHPLTAARTFNLVGKGTVDGTITIPIDEVPEGGGGTTVIKKNVVIFDD